MKVVFMGTPRFSVPALTKLAGNGHQIVAVYCRPDRPSGRGRNLVAPPVKEAALKLGLKVVQPESLKSGQAVAKLASFKPDIIVVAAYGMILPQAVLDIPELGCLNIHPSLLPRHRGASPVAAAILAGDEFTGVSIMLLDAGLDTGPVLSSAQIPIRDYDTTSSLADRLSVLAAQLLSEVMVAYPAGELVPEAQPEAGATYSHTIKKSDGRIDWQLPAVTIWRQVRAYQPWPGSYSRWQGKTLKIIKAVPLPATGDVNPGQVVELTEKNAAFGIGTGDGMLGVIKLQLEGKKAMSSAEFLRGQRSFLSSVLF